MSAWGSLKVALGYGPRPDFLASPFSDVQLAQVVYSDLFGAEARGSLSRLEAMGIPALSKARNLIVSTIAALPLRVANKAGLLADDDQPSWLYRTDGELSPFLRMLWTLDNMLFYGGALWQVVRGSEGQILTADWVPWEWWTVDNDGAIRVNTVLVDASDVIYFPSFVEGILDKDISSLRAARSIAASVETRTKSPIPVMEIHALEAGEIDKDEAKQLVTDYNAARRDPEGATVFTPASISLIPHGENADAGFMVEGRNAVRLDVANMTGVPAALLDGSVSQSSLTYSTQEGRRNEFVDYGLRGWMEAITGRLSQDDVVARGLHVVFDQTDYATTTPSPIGPEAQD
jgi:phage portal protein BeeE